MLEDDMGAIASDDMDEDDMAILSPLAIGAMASEEEDDISDMALSLFGGAEQAVTVTKVRARAAKASVRCMGISSDGVGDSRALSSGIRGRGGGGYSGAC